MGQVKSKSTILSSEQLVDLLLEVGNSKSAKDDVIPDAITKVTIQYVNGEIDSLFIDS